MRKRRREERAGEMTASSAEARVDVRCIRRDVHEHQLGPLIEDAVSGGDEAERSVLKLYRERVQEHCPDRSHPLESAVVVILPVSHYG